MGVLWKQRDFLSSSGTPIKNGQKANDLLTAILLSSEVAVIEIRVPTGKTGPEYQGMPQLISTQRQQLSICEDCGTTWMKSFCFCKKRPFVARLFSPRYPCNMATICSCIREIKMDKQWLRIKGTVRAMGNPRQPLGSSRLPGKPHVQLLHSFTPIVHLI